MCIRDRLETVSGKFPKLTKIFWRNKGTSDKIKFVAVSYTHLVRGREVQRRKVSGQSMAKEWICIRSEWDWMAVKRER